jgi:hypothetical protein
MTCTHSIITVDSDSESESDTLKHRDQRERLRNYENDDAANSKRGRSDENMPVSNKMNKSDDVVDMNLKLAMDNALSNLGSELGQRVATFFNTLMRNIRSNDTRLTVVSQGFDTRSVATFCRPVFPTEPTQHKRLRKLSTETARMRPEHGLSDC